MGTPHSHVDITLIGGGIMSATLGMLLKSVCPNASIAVFERLGAVAQESSDPWHNAGTGHAALCELHYTPELANGSIDTRKALLVNDQFQLSLQFYSWLVEQGFTTNPKEFINRVPHVGFTSGASAVDFMRRRHDALAGFPQFEGIEFTNDLATLADWVPLMADGRESSEPIAVTRSDAGTDVNFGALTRVLFEGLENLGADIALGHEVENLTRNGNEPWSVSVKDRLSGEKRTITSNFVFVGAGGTAVHLLQKSGIAEIKGVGGFPVSGQFLRCTNQELIDQHKAKVYGQPAAGAPPMTAPHLDTRIIDGKRGLMFGPFAGFTPKFLKKGSWFDLARSIRTDNILTMLAVAKDEMPLTAYLIKQVLQSKSARVDHLRGFIPTVRSNDWELIQAGQRVQVMKSTPQKRGILQFGTEVITSRDGTIAGLLGASPGASTATAIMLDVMERCFPNEYSQWKSRLQEIVPSLGVSLADDPTLFEALRVRTNRLLELEQPESAVASVL